MRIALLHSFYASDQSSGENVVVEAQSEALGAAGHDVLLLGRHTDDEQHLPGYKLRAAWRTITSFGPDPAPRLRQFAPDVVHIHNTVPNIGLHWMRRWPGPIVHTLHNFRPICANGLLFRDGRLCTDCPDGKPWSAVEHACYRESRVASTPIALRNTMGTEVNPLIARSDALVVLSPFARDTFARYGVGTGRLRLVPNGVTQVHAAASAMPDDSQWLAVGRLRAEKGFVELVRGWPANVRLDLVGDGPLRDELAELAGPRVHLRGQLPPMALRESLPTYRGLVFTSLAPESAMPLVIVEALEAGLPIVVSLNSPHAAQLISDGVAMGITVADGRVDAASLAAAMAWVEAGGDELRRRCREVFDERYTEAQWIERITEVYRSVGASGKPIPAPPVDAEDLP
ncbi:MAG: glycosyltransferase family 4 protein [Actinobacteria bacterium]|nr:glycosyltransferase family 4 protein [Actinomycetota bacterium]